MKSLFSIILLLFSLSMFSKTNFNDTIITKLHGQGCGIIPSVQENNYNITLLENLQKTDSNNILLYRHLAMQYYFSWAREKNLILKDAWRQKSINANLKVLKLHQYKKLFKNYTINNLLILYCLAGDCKNTKLYFSLLNKKSKKNTDIGTLALLKKNCNIK